MKLYELHSDAMVSVFEFFDWAEFFTLRQTCKRQRTRCQELYARRSTWTTVGVLRIPTFVLSRSMDCSFFTAVSSVCVQDVCQLLALASAATTTINDEEAAPFRFTTLQVEVPKVESGDGDDGCLSRSRTSMLAPDFDRIGVQHLSLDNIHLAAFHSSGLRWQHHRFPQIESLKLSGLVGGVYISLNIPFSSALPHPSPTPLWDMFPSLQTLEIYDSPKLVTDEWVEQVCLHMPQLQHLKLIHCRCFSVSNLSLLASRLVSLEIQDRATFAPQDVYSQKLVADLRAAVLMPKFDDMEMASRTSDAGERIKFSVPVDVLCQVGRCAASGATRGGVSRRTVVGIAQSNMKECLLPLTARCSSCSRVVCAGFKCRASCSVCSARLCRECARSCEWCDRNRRVGQVRQQLCATCAPQQLSRASDACLLRLQQSSVVSRATPRIASASSASSVTTTMERRRSRSKEQQQVRRNKKRKLCSGSSHRAYYVCRGAAKRLCAFS